MKMNIVLLHYHLRPGGVTTVMLRQADALREAGDNVLVLCGEAPTDTGWNIPVKVIPELHYDRCRPKNPGGSGEKLADSVIRELTNFHPDVIIVHNPLIRKNSLLLGALKELVRRGQALILQNHDLAEDSRPDVYANEDYPENCHYAVINSRDYNFLLEAGLTSEALHLIPNEVRPVSAAAGLERKRYLYPVRGIRRKNLGEAILLSLFIPEGKSVAISQPPTTSRGEAIYRGWKGLAGELKLPVEFETGNGKAFSEVLGSAFAVITTSIKEGFGFSFLEPWTANLAVTGRRIDYVCRDFEKEGLRFDDFYSSLALPLCSATKEYQRRFNSKLKEAAGDLYAAFGVSAKPFTEQSSLPEFGAMDEELQEDFIRKAAADKGLRDAVGDINPFLKNLADWRPDPALIDANRNAVLACYSRERIAGILRESCRKAAGKVVQSISRKKLLECFLDPSRLSLIGIDHE